MTGSAAVPAHTLDPGKFQDPDRTVTGEIRARVRLGAIQTLWFNTGTLCNLTCRNCYMESSPTNDRLVYLSAAEVATYLDELAALSGEAEDTEDREIGFTGGEPFMNPEIVAMLADALERGHRVLVLTNAMLPMRHRQADLLALKARHGDRLTIRVSIDHYTPALHELERGARSWDGMKAGLCWLAENGFHFTIAGRTCWGESADVERGGYARLFANLGLAVNVADPSRLVLFPEMDEDLDVPEISEACWRTLGVSPGAMMCAGSRMVVKRKGSAHPVVVPCTLLPYDERFEMGRTLAESLEAVKLNHPHCARFCVLGGGSCSAPCSG